MRIYEAIILGAVQGLTEFLPVSSSGHLILAERWLGVNTDGGLFFDIMLHIGTLIPVSIVFFGSIMRLFKKPFKTLLYLIIATIPAAVTGFLFQDKIETLYKGGDLAAAVLLAVSFVLTAAELILAQKISENNKNVLPLSLKSSIIMGVFQGLAIVPGLSRSGTVFTGGTVAGVNKADNAEFAFLMSIPVILGAAAANGIKLVGLNAEIDIMPVMFGVISAAVTGYLSVNVMLTAIKKAKFKAFSVYLVILAAASVLSKVIFGV